MSMLCTLLLLQNAISVDMVSQGLRRNFLSSVCASGPAFNRNGFRASNSFDVRG